MLDFWPKKHLFVFPLFLSHFIWHATVPDPARTPHPNMYYMLLQIIPHAARSTFPCKGKAMCHLWPLLACYCYKPLPLQLCRQLRCYFANFRQNLPLHFLFHVVCNPVTWHKSVFSEIWQHHSSYQGSVNRHSAILWRGIDEQSQWNLCAPCTQKAIHAPISGLSNSQSPPGLPYIKGRFINIPPSKHSQNQISVISL